MNMTANNEAVKRVLGVNRFFRVLPSQRCQDNTAQPIRGRRSRVHAHVEGDALDHGRFVLVKDSPLLAPLGVPDADGVVVELSLGARQPLTLSLGALAHRPGPMFMRRQL